MKNIAKSLLLLIIISFLGCNKQQKVEIFDNVDCSIYHGYFKSIKVFADGRTYIRFDKSSHINQNTVERSDYYSFVLDKVELDSISRMVKALMTIRVDSLAELSSDNRISFCILIKKDSKHQHTSNNRGLKPESDLKPAYQLVNYLDELSNNVRLTADSAFIFDSRNKLICPQAQTKSI